ncbi:probable protein S-acyltransferase 23 isoform X2 [Anneissia japonica]|uniref:probable protein S-acyltransferase 23 isoform X2 n=1 Tax=Anneissia japonica TaxID=1529436 RepID=UPI001425B0EC|nr:probable protein S-acyltransferase 23 isoform X2 [Anneissia japonica]
MSKKEASLGHDCKDHEKGNSSNKFRKGMDIFSAVKSGFLIRVQEMIEEEGPEVLSSTDEKGHTPVHWAALGGHTNIIRLMVDHKANLDVQSKNDLGPRPIHWACVNGHVAVADILLQAGVNIDTIDNKGCSPLIISCQYGQTTLACYLMAKGARLQLTDREGDNALHWAAFKGHCELTRLLIYSGFNPRQIDNYGQTPLHLACISGDLNTVKMLCEQDGVEIDRPDHNHKTPMMLAQGRNHKDLITYLEGESKIKASFIPRINFKSIIFGPAGKSKGPFLFYIFNVLFWGYPMYMFKCVPTTFALNPGVHYVFLFLNVIMWYTLYKAYSLDPGFLPKNSSDYDQAIKRVAHFDEWKQGQNPLKRLCHTCRLVKPMRAKHCRICNRCVQHFDHHCPYVYNCVGYKNRTYFVGFTSCVSLLAMFTFYFSYVIISLEGWQWLYIIGILEVSFFGLVTSGLCCATWYMAMTNTNTNERINYKKYDYLKDGNNHYHNPFDRGVRYNCQEYFHFRKPMVDEEVENIYAYTV